MRKRTFGSAAYSSVAVLPGGVLWAFILPSFIDVFDIGTGLQTGTITLDHGQQNAFSMFYSALTNTVLMADADLHVYERDTSGGFVRLFNSLQGFGQFRGVTTGPGGDVFATLLDVFRWHRDGAFVSITNIGAINLLQGIVWAGNVFPGAGMVNGVTETEFKRATLSPAELANLQSACAFINSQGSGHGICSCGRGD